MIALLLSFHAVGDDSADDSVVVHSTAHFRIAHLNEPTKAQLVGDVLEETYALVDSALRNLLFEPATPTNTMEWMCFSDRDRFEAYAASHDRADVSNLNGYYSPRSNRVVLFWGTPSFVEEFQTEPATVPAPAPASAQPLAGSLTSRPLLPIIVHESVHQIAYSRKLQEPGRRYPLWFTEGLALYVEHHSLDARRASPQWSATLVRLRNEGQLLPLMELALIGEVTYTDLQRIRPLYAQAWGVFAFLAETRSDALLRYVKSLRESNGRAPLRLEEFEGAFGDLTRLEHEWIGWLASLEL